MSPRSSLALRVFAGMTALIFIEGDARAADGPRIVNAAPGEQAAIERAFHLLSRKPEAVAVVDPAEATPEGRKVLARSDAFITKGGRIVYLNRQSEVLRGAQQGSSILDCMLAAIIWHEMAHIDGADEAAAQRRE